MRDANDTQRWAGFGVLRVGLRMNVDPSGVIDVDSFQVTGSSTAWTESGGTSRIIETDTTTTVISEVGWFGLQVEIKEDISSPPFRTLFFDHDIADELVLTDTRGQNVRETVWLREYPNDEWELITGDGARLEHVELEYSADPLIRIERRKIYEPAENGELVSDRRIHIKDYGWGERVIREEIDPDGANLRHPDPAGPDP